MHIYWHWSRKGLEHREHQQEINLSCRCSVLSRQQEENQWNKQYLQPTSILNGNIQIFVRATNIFAGLFKSPGLCKQSHSVEEQSTRNLSRGRLHLRLWHRNEEASSSYESKLNKEHAECCPNSMRMLQSLYDFAYASNIQAGPNDWYAPVSWRPGSKILFNLYPPSAVIM